MDSFGIYQRLFLDIDGVFLGRHVEAHALELFGGEGELRMGLGLFREANKRLRGKTLLLSPN